LGEAFGAEPKPLPIVGQEFERRASAVPENVDGAPQWVLGQSLATQRGEAINAFAKVYGLHGEKDATLRRELEH
jgi:hypothetical protein